MSEKIKFVDLSELPLKKNLNINWEKSIGCQCSFIYGELTGKFKITDYKSGKNSMVEITYNDRKTYISTSNLKCGNIGNVLGVFTSDFKFDINQVVERKRGNIKIINRFYKIENNRKRKYYEYQCCECKQYNTTTEAILLKGSGCPVCAGRNVCIGVNDIPTVAPWLAQYFPSIEEAQKYTVNSMHEFYPICPICKKKSSKKISISQLYNSHSCGCKCDTYMSFPETVLYNFLEQFNIEFIHQATKKELTWANNYKYDFYLPQYNAIIEVHGLQHFDSHGFSTLGGKTLKEEQLNDYNKKQLAINNHISNYYIIDSRKSDVNWILNSIENSGLLLFLNISPKDINVNELYYSVFQKKINKCREIVENTPDISLNALQQELHVCRNTLNSILKISKINITSSHRSYKTIPVALYKDGILLHVFASQTELLKNCNKICAANIRTHNIGKYINEDKLYKEHYSFKYVSESEEIYASDMVAA